MLSCENICIHLRGKPLFAPLSFTVRRGEIVALMGASGSGKSSVIAAIAGVLSEGLEMRGGVVLNGRDLHGVPPESRRVGLLFQDDLLFPHLSVAGNLSFALPSHLSKPVREARIATALAQIELSGFEKYDPATLSGGQRARVAMQRVLLSEPQCLLLDEPFGKLDQELRARFREDVFHHIAEQKLPCVMVSHDPADTEHPQIRQILQLD